MTDSSATKPDAAAVSGRMPRGLTAFVSVPFRWLIGSLMSFYIAMLGGFLVRSLLAWELTQSELALAWVNLIAATPMLIGSFVAGAIIDRVEKRRLIMISQALIILNESTIMTLALLDMLQYWELLVSTFVFGVLMPFVMPTRTSMVYPLVGREHLGNAMALQSATINLGRILGPSITGMLIPLLTLPGAYSCMIGLYILSTITMLKVPPVPAGTGVRKSLLNDVRYSFTYVGQRREILLCLIFGLVPMMLVMPVFNMLVVFTDEVWGTGESGLGILMAMVGIGGIVGSVVVARMSNSASRANWMMAAALGSAFMLACFSISPSFIAALGLMMGATLFSDISQTMNNTLVQVLADNEVRGRMSSFLTLSIGLTPLAVLPMARSAESFGIANTVFTGCTIMMLVVVLFYAISPTLRRLDSDLAAGRYNIPEGANQT
jgi:MFS family permease